MAHHSSLTIRNYRTPEETSYGTATSGVLFKEGGTGVASDGSRRRMGAVTPGVTLGTIDNICAGRYKTKATLWHTTAARLDVPVARRHGSAQLQRRKGAPLPVATRRQARAPRGNNAAPHVH